MNKYSELRRVIMEQLQTIPGGTYHRTAPDNAAYPYKVFTLDNINLNDLSRDDLSLCVDIWDRGTDPKTAEDLACQVAELFAAANLPQDTILPTLYRSNGFPVDDPDRELIHYQMHFDVQMY